MSRRRNATFLCTAAFVASSVSGSDNDPGSGERGATAVMSEAAARRPILHPRLSESVTATFNEAISVAHERLRNHASCQALFAQLGADGAATVNGASYYPASPEQERRYCRRGVSAVTTVGGSAVVLCRSFGRVSGQQAAIILIHEALQLAGQTEYPLGSGAPDSFAITKVVMKDCHLF